MQLRPNTQRGKNRTSIDIIVTKSLRPLFLLYNEPYYLVQVLIFKDDMLKRFEYDVRSGEAVAHLRSLHTISARLSGGICTFINHTGDPDSDFEECERSTQKPTKNVDPAA